jgi:hypothetical protein
MVRVTSRGVLFAKSSDRDPNEGQGIEWHPRSEHPAGARLRCTWIEIPQARRTWSTLISRPFWGWGAEIGTNEHGVTIGNEAVFTLHAVPRIGLTGMDLLRLALERAQTAREAVDVIRELAARFGQGGGCGHEDRSFRYFSSFLIADPEAAFVLETAGGESAAERVEGARSISNLLTIPSLLRLRDPVRTAFAAGEDRRLITHRFAEAAQTPRDLTFALRDHGPSGPTPRYALHHGAMRAPCMHAGGVIASSQTTASWIAEIGRRGVRHWVTATAAPCTSIFKPVRIDRPMALGPFPTDVADGSLFWRHERFHRLAIRDPATWLPFVERERALVERRFFESEVEPEEAFARSDALLDRWLAIQNGDSADDVRPWWVRRYWAARDRAARIA